MAQLPGRWGPAVRRATDMNARKTGLVIGLAAMLMLTGVGGATASAERGSDGPCPKGSAACTPADVAKAEEAKRDAKKKEFRDGKPGCSPEKVDKFGKDKRSEGPSEAAVAKALAGELGVEYKRALKAIKEINALNKEGRADPESAAFARVAEHLGVSPKRLLKALRNIKLAFAKSEGEVREG